MTAISSLNTFDSLAEQTAAYVAWAARLKANVHKAKTEARPAEESERVVATVPFFDQHEAVESVPWAPLG